MREVGDDEPTATTATTGATMREVVGGDQQATLFCERGRKEEC